MKKNLNINQEMSRTKGNLEERLKAHPQLLERIEALLNVVENTGQENEQADLAEERVREEVRHIGQQALSSWADSQHQKQLKLMQENNPQARKHLKKNSIGIVALEP